MGFIILRDHGHRLHYFLVGTVLGFVKRGWKVQERLYSCLPQVQEVFLLHRYRHAPILLGLRWYRQEFFRSRLFGCEVCDQHPRSIHMRRYLHSMRPRPREFVSQEYHWYLQELVRKHGWASQERLVTLHRPG